MILPAIWREGSFVCGHHLSFLLELPLAVKEIQGNALGHKVICLEPSLLQNDQVACLLLLRNLQLPSPSCPTSNKVYPCIQEVEVLFHHIPKPNWDTPMPTHFDRVARMLDIEAKGFPSESHLIQGLSQRNWLPASSSLHWDLQKRNTNPLHTGNQDYLDPFQLLYQSLRGL